MAARPIDPGSPRPFSFRMKIASPLQEAPWWERVPAWAAALAIYLITLTVYLPVYGAGFVWNDFDYVMQPHLRSWAGLARIWCDVGATEQYYPLLHSAFWLQHQLWGDSASAYHLLNVVLHATAAVLFGLTLKRVGVRGHWIAALIFAVHPVGVESVAWIAEEKNTLSLCLYLAAALVYLRFEEKRGVGAYVSASLLFVGALLTKSLTATLPGALLVVAWWRRGRLEWRRDFLPLVPWLMVGAGVGLFTGWVEKVHVGATGADFELSWAQRWLLAGRISWFYAGKLLCPQNLMFIYPRWEVNPATAWQHLFPLAAVGVLVAAWFLRQRSRAFLATLLLFGGGLFPVLGFFGVYGFVFSYVADHWQYHACLALIAAAGALLARMALRLRGTGLMTAGVVALATLLGWQSTRLTHGYESLTVFYETILRKNPDAWMAHNNLGDELLHAGQYQQAEEHFSNAVRLRPGYFDAHNNLGLALDALGRPAEAVEHFRRAVELNPGYAQAHANFGNVAFGLGNREEAERQFRAALQIDPALPRVHYNLAVVLAEKKQWAEAISHYERAAELDPASAETRFNLANTLRDSGRLNDAIQEYRRALAIAPAAEIYNNLGTALLAANQAVEAETSFRAAVKLAPDMLPAQMNLALALKRLGRMEEAQQQAEQVRRMMERAR